jgi:hypothetical protein
MRMRIRASFNNKFSVQSSNEVQKPSYNTRS